MLVLLTHFALMRIHLYVNGHVANKKIFRPHRSKRRVPRVMSLFNSAIDTRERAFSERKLYQKLQHDIEVAWNHMEANT